MPLPLPAFDTSTEEGRELALDALGLWFTEALVAAEGDHGVAFDVMCRGISAFYDIREAADTPRCMYAGHFFMVDAVGLAYSDRPVPWVELSKRVMPEVLEAFQNLFDRAERATS